jgi:hypothetical protein
MNAQQAEPDLTNLRALIALERENLARAISAMRWSDKVSFAVGSYTKIGGSTDNLKRILQELIRVRLARKFGELPFAARMFEAKITEAVATEMGNLFEKIVKGQPLMDE